MLELLSCCLGALCPPNSAACMIKVNETDPKKRYVKFSTMTSYSDIIHWLLFRQNYTVHKRFNRKPYFLLNNV